MLAQKHKNKIALSTTKKGEIYADGDTKTSFERVNKSLLDKLFKINQ